MTTKKNKRTCLKMRGRVEAFLNKLPKNQKGPIVNDMINFFLEKTDEEKLKNILLRYFSIEEADDLLANLHDKKQTDETNEKIEEPPRKKPFITFDDI